MTLSETMKKWSKKILDCAATSILQYGDMNNMITYIDNMSNRFQYGNYECCLDDNYFVCYSNKYFSIYSTKNILYCYQSRETHFPYHYEIGLSTNSGSADYFNFTDVSTMSKLYNFLCSYVPHIESHIANFESFEENAILGKSIKIEDGKFTLFKRYKPLFSNQYKEKVYYEAKASDIIRCYQTHHLADEGTDSFELYICFLDGKHICYKIPPNSHPDGCIEAFKLALKIKNNVPQLLYGWSDDNIERRL